MMNTVAKEIYEATSYGDVNVVKRLLKIATFEDLIYKNPNDLHKTAVMVAAYHGHTEIIRSILSHSIASVYIQDEAGWTALMYAAYKGHTSTVNAILLHREVDVNTQNNDGWTALMLAAAECRPCTVRALLTRPEIDVNIQNNQDGGTALLLACIRGHTEVVRDILSVKGVMVNLEDGEGRLPLFAAKNDEITALISFYDPVLGLVYPEHDLPVPPKHSVVSTIMPPHPPVDGPTLALSVEFSQCEEETESILKVAPFMQTRAAWHQHRVALQAKMEAAVHIHHHKEAALIGRELLAFKATTASTAELRGLSEQDYVHLAERVAVLEARLQALCKKLSLVEDFDTMEKAAALLESLKSVDLRPPPPVGSAHTDSYNQAHQRDHSNSNNTHDGAVPPPPPPPPPSAPANTPNVTGGKSAGPNAHTIHTALEALAVSEAKMALLVEENESLRVLNRALSGKMEEEVDAGATLDTGPSEVPDNTSTSTTAVLPPPPPSPSTAAGEALSHEHNHEHQA